MNPNPPQENLKPFQPGNRTQRGSAAKMRALSKSRLVSPECVDYFVSVMRDPDEPTQCRLKAADSILRVAFPTQNVAQVNLAESGEKTGRRFLEIRFVDPEDAELLDARPNGHDTFTVAFDP